MRDLTLPAEGRAPRSFRRGRVETVRELAERTGAAIPARLIDGRWGFAGFDDFIAQYTGDVRVAGTTEDFRRIALRVPRGRGRTGVRYAEVVFSPSNHAPRLGEDGFGPIEAGPGTASRRAGATSA